MRTIERYLGLILWMFFAKYLPKSVNPVIGPISKKIRAFCAKLIFKKVGRNVNLENLAYFGNGFEIEIGDNSGIGKRCRVPSNIEIGNNVMMAEEVIILNQNHQFIDASVPLNVQGYQEKTKLKIGNDVWIGTRVIILPQVKSIGNGAIIGAGSVLTKNVDSMAIVAGNPARLIKKRE
jgi:maltose O-acetyltransferase